MEPLTEDEIYTKEPESMNVGKLNILVRRLRELAYEQGLEIARLKTRLAIRSEFPGEL